MKGRIAVAVLGGAFALSGCATTQPSPPTPTVTKRTGRGLDRGANARAGEPIRAVASKPMAGASLYDRLGAGPR